MTEALRNRLDNSRSIYFQDVNEFTPSSIRSAVAGEELPISAFEQSRSVSTSGSVLNFITSSFSEYLKSIVLSLNFPFDTIDFVFDESIAFSIAHQVNNLAILVTSFEEVYVQKNSWGFEVWTVLNNSTEEERLLIYDIEWQIAEGFSETELYFNIIDRENEPVEGLFSVTDDMVHIKR